GASPASMSSAAAVAPDSAASVAAAASPARGTNSNAAPHTTAVVTKRASPRRAHDDRRVVTALPRNRMMGNHGKTRRPAEVRKWFFGGGGVHRKAGPAPEGTGPASCDSDERLRNDLGDHVRRDFGRRQGAVVDAHFVDHAVEELTRRRRVAADAECAVALRDHVARTLARGVV